MGFFCLLNFVFCSWEEFGLRVIFGLVVEKRRFIFISLSMKVVFVILVVCYGEVRVNSFIG